MPGSSSRCSSGRESGGGDYWGDRRSERENVASECFEILHTLVDYTFYFILVSVGFEEKHLV